MANCERCGLPLPDGAEYCPNCGTPVRKRREVSIPIAAPIARLLEAGLLGAFISVMITTFTPPNVNPYFLPSFIGALVAIYLSRTRRLDESIMIAFAVYLFADALLGGLFLGTLYAENISLSEAYTDQVLTMFDVALYVANPVTAVIAGYIGNRLVSGTQVREPTPYTYGKREEQGGIVYSVDSEEKELSAHFPHKV